MEVSGAQSGHYLSAGAPFSLFSKHSFTFIWKDSDASLCLDKSMSNQEAYMEAGCPSALSQRGDTWELHSYSLGWARHSHWHVGFSYQASNMGVFHIMFHRARNPTRVSPNDTFQQILIIGKVLHIRENYTSVLFMTTQL